MKTILSLVLLAVIGGLASAAEKPNIVFILADDLGINDLGCYGRKEHHTPNLDRLAGEGMRFTQAYAACPVCSPTRASILTGKHPARLHITTFLSGRADAPSQKLLHPKITLQLPLEELTLAEYLKEAGYTSACIGKWHLGGAMFSPKQQGFDFVHAGRGNTPPSATEGGKGEYDLTAKAEEFMAANAGKPFFLYLAHHTPHIPLGAKKELIEKYKDTFNPVYAAIMHEMDECVGRVLRKLDELKLAENTIVVFMSDNGGLHVPELKDDPPTHNTPFRAGKGFLYEGGIRVPQIVRWPGKIKAGSISDVPTISTDWTPTFLDICGLADRFKGDGASIKKALVGEPMSMRSLYWHIPHYTNQGSRPSGAIVRGNMKFIVNYENDSAELYDLGSDPGETKNLAAAQADRVRKLRMELDRWLEETKSQKNTPNPDFDAKLHDMIYTETDVSLLKPKATAAETATAYRAWRQAIDDVVRKRPKK